MFCNMHSVKMSSFRSVALLAALSAVVLAATVGCSSHYRGGPPVYTSAYYHYPYRYHYYPSSQVYFHITSGNYYYRDGTKWVRTRTLPSRHHLDSHDRVPLWIDSEKPHVKHKEHRERYRPSPQYRQNKTRDPKERRHNQRMHERFDKRRD